MRFTTVRLSALAFLLCTSVGFAVAQAGCVHAPASLSPAGQQAFTNTRVLKGLDILRDFAIDANAQTPPVLSTATTRKIVTYHESTVKIIHGLPSGWKATAQTGLTELSKDLPPAEAKALAPYLTLLATVLSEVN